MFNYVDYGLAKIQRIYTSLWTTLRIVVENIINKTEYLFNIQI